MRGKAKASATNGSIAMPSTMGVTFVFDEKPALSAIKKWRFEPHLEGGVPVTVRSGVRFKFEP